MQRIKRFAVLTLALVFSFALAGLALAQQDTNTPAASGWSTLLGTAFSDLKGATNVAVVPYASYGLNNHKTGAGVLALYDFNQYVGSGLGLDYLGQCSMVSANVELKLPVRPLAVIGVTNLVATPLVYSGIGTPLSGAGTDNGQVSTHLGAGLNVDAAKLWGGTVSVGGAYVSRTGAGDYSGKYVNVFLAWRIGF